MTLDKDLSVLHELYRALSVLNEQALEASGTAWKYRAESLNDDIVDRTDEFLSDLRMSISRYQHTVLFPLILDASKAENDTEKLPPRFSIPHSHSQ